MAELGNNIAKLFAGSIFASALAGWSLFQLYGIATSADYVIISFALLVNGIAPFLDFGISRYNIRLISTSKNENVRALLTDWSGTIFALSFGVGTLGFIISLGYLHTLSNEAIANSVAKAICIGIVGAISLYVSALRSMSEYEGKFGFISQQRVLFAFGMLVMYISYVIYYDIILALFIVLLFRLFNLIFYSLKINILPRIKSDFFSNLINTIKNKDLLWISGCNIIYFLLVMLERFFSAQFFSNDENASYVFVLEIIGFLFVAASSLNSVLYPYYSKGLGKEWTTSRTKTILLAIIGLSVILIIEAIDLDELIILNKTINMNLIAVCSVGAVFNIMSGVKLSMLNARGNYRSPFIFNLIELFVVALLILTLGHWSIEVFAILFTLRYMLDFIMLSISLQYVSDTSESYI